ncbi:hypothetical protein D3C87_1284780 [compost metagenome]
MIDNSVLSKSLAEILHPDDQQDEFTKWMLKENEGVYIGAKRLPDGTYAGVMRLAFTEAICLGVTHQCPAEKRYCFEPGDFAAMLIAFDKLTSFNDEPVGWIASRPKAQEEDFQPLVTAPKDGSTIRLANFKFGHCHWCRSGIYEKGHWVEVDSPREGQPLVEPTHWKP